MFKRINNTIMTTRGDSVFLPIAIQNGEEPYILADNDALTFTLKENTNKGESLISKTLTKADEQDGVYVLKLTPSETANLRYKDYWYDIQLSINNGEIVNTIVPPNIFRILEEVTF